MTHTPKPCAIMKRSLFCILFAFITALPASAQKKPLTWTDIMKFRAVEDPVISDDGNWIAFTAQPDRGDGEVVIQKVSDDTRFTIPLGSNPVFSKDAGWVAAKLNPTLEAQEKAGDDDKPKAGMAFLNTSTGDIQSFDDIKSFAFSYDGEWLAIHHEAEEKAEEEGEKDDFGATAVRPIHESAQPESAQHEAAQHESAQHEAAQPSALQIHHLPSGDRLTLENIRDFAFDEANRYIVYSISTEEGKQNSLLALQLETSLFENNPITIDTRERGRYSELAWSKADNTLAFLAATDAEEGEPGDAELYVWDGNTTREAPKIKQAGWYIPSKNSLQWTENGDRLFFGLRPRGDDIEKKNAEADSTFDPYDSNALLEDREVDVWHWNDPLINSNQKKRWKDEQERTYAAVYHVNSGMVTPLADELVRDTQIPENDRWMLARAPGPYSKERTWDGSYFDLYLIDINSGDQSKVGERLQHTSSLSPGGSYVVYYKDPHWYLVDLGRDEVRNLTENFDISFANEDHDYPQDAPGYGVAGWVENDEAVLIHDKYDVWIFPTNGNEPTNLTKGEGRKEKRIFRVIKTDPDQDAFEKNQRLLLSSYHDLQKNYGFYETQLGKAGVKQLLEEDKRFRFLAKAKDADVLLFTREAYDEFPDLWVSDLAFASPQKITDVNPQMQEFAWGTSELVEWNSVDGIPLQGVVIKPDGYDPNRRYPVLVYFYRFFSQRLHEFNQPRVNHRPAFPLYVSNDYVVFLPDVRFEVGRPGFSATKCIVPGVQKLVDLGIADSDAVGLHGHSWSGYQTAFMVTQTDIFAAAIAGAPVSNMTSAYSGIRWQTGLARQFQYEKSQSRLGGSLWEARDHYIDNSPVFFADRINTPLLIMHGDDDGAVPWYQSIELYLALRRLEKDAIFLQYRGEPHHLVKYPNRLDYAIKMKDYFDHYLKGEPAADWIVKGAPYKGK